MCDSKRGAKQRVESYSFDDPTLRGYFNQHLYVRDRFEGVDREWLLNLGWPLTRLVYSIRNNRDAPVLALGGRRLCAMTATVRPQPCRFRSD